MEEALQDLGNGSAGNPTNPSESSMTVESADILHSSVKSDNPMQEEAGSPAYSSCVGSIRNGSDYARAIETLQPVSLHNSRANVVLDVNEEMTETSEFEILDLNHRINEAEADECTKRRLRFLPRRTKSGGTTTVPCPAGGISAGAFPVGNHNPLSGGVALPLPIQQAPESAFKLALAAAESRVNEKQLVGALNTTQQPQQQMQKQPPRLELMTSNDDSISTRSHDGNGLSLKSSGESESGINIDILSAHMVPETQLDLERAIRQDLLRSKSLMRDMLKDAPVATIVPVEDTHHSTSHSDFDEFLEEESTQDDKAVQSYKSRTQSRQVSLGQGAFLLLLLLVSITITVLAAKGYFSGNDKMHQDMKDKTAAKSYDDNFVLALVPETIAYDRLPYMGYRDHPPQTLGSPVTNLVAHSRLWRLPEADMAILNAGEIKSEVKQGNFTYGNLTGDFMPYRSSLVIVTLQGIQIRSLLERVLQGIVNDLELAILDNHDALVGAYPYAAGLRYHVNLSQPFPRRISNLEVNQQLARNHWTSLNTTAVYRIVTNSYLLHHGGDGYHELAQGEARVTELYAQDAFVEYCLHHKVLLTPPFPTYSTQSFHFVPGMYDNWNV